MAGSRKSRRPGRRDREERDRRDRPDRAKPPAPGRLAPALGAAAAAVLITLGLYAAAFSHGFVSLDDATYVTQNPLVQNRDYGALLTSVVNNSYHPLTMLSLAMDASHPLSARPFLVTNVVLHLLDTGLVFWLAFLLSRRRIPVAFLTALLFGVHPMHVESVAWVSSRKDVLYALFFLAGLLTYWRYLDRRAWPWLVATFVSFVLSCLSKGMAVVFPVLLFALDYWKGRRADPGRAILEKAPFFAVSLLFGLIAVDVESGGSFHGLFTIVDRQLKATVNTTAFPFFARVALPAYGFMAYLGRLLVPVRLGVFYPYPSLEQLNGPLYWLSIPFFLVAIGTTIWALRRARTLAFGLGWFLITIFPVLQWLPVGASMLADRMTYVAYVGPFFALAMGADAWIRKPGAPRAAVTAAAAIALALLFVRSAGQIATWKDSETLWSNVIRLYPESPRPRTSRGNARGQAGRIDDAMADFQAALRLGSRRGEVYDGLGNAYGSKGNLDSALVMFDRALAVDSTLTRTYYNRAIVHLRLGQPREALADLDRTLALAPIQAPFLHFPRANAYLALGRYAEAEAEFGRAIDAGQMVTDALTNRGICRLRENDAAGARADFEAALRLDPGFAPARAQLSAMGR
jgi:tetratricopeptide (TPR) repeat protein